MKQFKTKIVLNDKDDTVISSQIWNIDESVVARGKWVNLYQTISTDFIESGTLLTIHIDEDDNPDATSTQTIYFDSLKWIELNPRP